MSSGMYLVKDLDAKDIVREPIRFGFGKGLVEAGRRNENIVALCADLTGSTKMDGFAKEFPERFVQTGIQEQNLTLVSAGMAAMGKIPFCTSYAAFHPGRSFDQIRTMVCMNQWPVKIIGSHAGVSVGPDGGTHQMLEDIAMMRALPNMVVVAPGDSIEAEKATIALAEDARPAYMRLAREPTPVFTSQRTPFSLNRAFVLSPGTDVSIIATGSMTYQALLASERLYKEGIDAEVVHVPVIKPLDTMTLLRSLEKTGAVVTVEEAQIIGGLGGAIAEFAGEHKPVPVKRIGIRDRFGESGEPDELLVKFHLTAKDIAAQVHELMIEMGRE